MKPLIISTLSVVLIALLLAQCDMRSPEVREAERIKRCQEMIKHPAPVIPENASDKEKNAIEDEIFKYEKCRKLIEDRELPGEIKRFPNDFDFKNYTYIKVGGKFIKIPRKIDANLGIVIPHIWQYDYPANESIFSINTISAGKNGYVYFYIDSVNSYQSHRIDPKKEIPDYRKACIQNKYRAFIWNDIKFVPDLSEQQSKQEWQTLCPEAVKIVSQFEEIPLQPATTPTKP